MLTIACVQTANYLGRGSEYVAKLFAGIRQHMPKDIAWRAACLTDDPTTLPDGVRPLIAPSGLKGWFNKIALFKPGMFEPGERIVFFDLDTIIVGDLRDIVTYDGEFAALRDFFSPMRLQSAVMAWEAGKHDHIWTRWDAGGRPQFDPRGDQAWIEAMMPKADYWQDFIPEQLVSFKRDCWPVGRIPRNARVICFHGLPRPHECESSFIQRLWNQPPLSVAA